MALFGCQSTVGPAESDDAIGEARVAVQQPPGETLLLANAQIVDPREGKTYVGHILVEGGVIQRVYRAVVPNNVNPTEIHDLGGRFVIPGLHDMHVHNWGDNIPPTGRYNSPQHDYVGVEMMGYRMLYTGVTTYLDLFSPEDNILDARNRSRDGTLLHPRLYAAGPLFTVSGGHGDFGFGGARLIDAMGSDQATVESECARLVDELVASGDPDVIKIIYDHNEGRPDGLEATMPKFGLAALVEAAHSHNLPAVAHVGTWQDVRDVIEVGGDMITHTPVGPMPSDMPAAMIEHGLQVIPTAVAYIELGEIASKVDQLLADPLLMAVTTVPHVESYRDEFFWTSGDQAWAEWARTPGNNTDRLENIRRMISAGVVVAAGTDAGNTGTFVGYSIHRELELLVERGGVPPMAALKAATVTAGELFGQAVGFRSGDMADFVVLDASPLTDISNTQTIHDIYFRGQRLARDTILVPPGRP